MKMLKQKTLKGCRSLIGLVFFCAASAHSADLGPNLEKLLGDYITGRQTENVDAYDFASYQITKLIFSDPRSDFYRQSLIEIIDRAEKQPELWHLVWEAHLTWSQSIEVQLTYKNSKDRATGATVELFTNTLVSWVSLVPETRKKLLAMAARSPVSGLALRTAVAASPVVAAKLANTTYQSASDLLASYPPSPAELAGKKVDLGKFTSDAMAFEDFASETLLQSSFFTAGNFIAGETQDALGRFFKRRRESSVCNSMMGRLTLLDPSAPWKQKARRLAKSAGAGALGVAGTFVASGLLASGYEAVVQPTSRFEEDYLSAVKNLSKVQQEGTFDLQAAREKLIVSTVNLYNLLTHNFIAYGLLGKKEEAVSASLPALTELFYQEYEKYRTSPSTYQMPTEVEELSSRHPGIMLLRTKIALRDQNLESSPEINSLLRHYRESRPRTYNLGDPA